MRVVPDTNTVVSGLLWHGAPRLVLDLARRGEITLYTSPDLIAELREVLGRSKLKNRLQLVDVSVRDLTLRYASLAHLVRPGSIPPVILNDPDDDMVLACALAANAEMIISGDLHLRDLKTYQGIPVVTANDLLKKFIPPSGSGRSSEPKP